MNLPVTILYGSLSILITLSLALNTSLHRVRHRLFVSDPVPDHLHRKIRAHGNSVEYLAVSIFLLAFLELQGVSSLWLHVCGGIIVLARLGHSLAMLTRSRLGTITASITYAVSFVMVIWSLILRLR